VPLAAVAAFATGHVEGNRNEVALLDEFHVAADFNDLARVLVPKYHSRRSREAAPVDVLIATANVGDHELENYAVLTFLSPRVHQFGIIKILDLEFTRSYVCNCTISGHACLLSVPVVDRR
jgi:hypothetical protein